VTLSASIRPVVPSFRRQSVLCTSGTKMHGFAMYIWKTTSCGPVHHHSFHRASGSKGAGLYVSTGYNKAKNTTHLLISCIEELIAPSSVEFYDSKWNEFGTKASLCQQIADITGIDPLVLRGANPTRRTVAERMSWASAWSTRVLKTLHTLLWACSMCLCQCFMEREIGPLYDCKKRS
jgi:hypothetical protein